MLPINALWFVLRPSWKRYWCTYIWRYTPNLLIVVKIVSDPRKRHVVFANMLCCKVVNVLFDFPSKDLFRNFIYSFLLDRILNVLWWGACSGLNSIAPSLPLLAPNHNPYPTFIPWLWNKSRISSSCLRPLRVPSPAPQYFLPIKSW